MKNDFKMRGDHGDVIIGSRAEFWIVYVPMCAYVACVPLVLASMAAWMKFDPATTREQWSSFESVVLNLGSAWLGITLWLARLWWRRKHALAAERGSASSSATESAR